MAVISSACGTGSASQAGRGACAWPARRSSTNTPRAHDVEGHHLAQRLRLHDQPYRPMPTSAQAQCGQRLDAHRPVPAGAPAGPFISSASTSVSVGSSATSMTTISGLAQPSGIREKAGRHAPPPTATKPAAPTTTRRAGPGPSMRGASARLAICTSSPIAARMVAAWNLPPGWSAPDPEQVGADDDAHRRQHARQVGGDAVGSAVARPGRPPQAASGGSTTRRSAR